MVAGQGVLSGALDVSALAAVHTRLEERQAARGAAHAADLRDALELHRIHAAAGLALGAVSELGLVLRCSEKQAGELLGDAQVLASLPGAFEALVSGLLTIEQSRVLGAQLLPLRTESRLVVWEQLHGRLELDAQRGAVLPKARLRELVDRLVKQADGLDAAQRRTQASEARAISYRKRDDGLVDLFAFGLTAPNAQACLSRIRDAARPLGPADERTADLVGHGPIEPDLLDAILLASPDLRAVFVDEHGIPVAASGTVLTPGRGDHAGLREALLRLASSPPPSERVPRHPDDHGSAPASKPPPDDPPPDPPPDDPPPDRPRGLQHPHPVGTPGPYRPSASLRRFLRIRAPRCEWPGCGARAACCDQDHDTAWPFGPTCGCNLGTLCRRHHRVKQTGWTKTRRPDGVRWSSPAGRTWLSPHQHTAPGAPLRPVPALVVQAAHDDLSPLELEQLLWDLDPSDPRLDGAFVHDPPPDDLEPDDDGDDGDDDHVRLALLDDLTRWTLDLDDPFAWADR